MPNNLKPLLLMPHRLRPLLTMRRPTLRFQVTIIVETETQRGYNPQQQYPQPDEETTDLSMVSQWAMNLMILGITILLLVRQSISTTTTIPTI